MSKAIVAAVGVAAAVAIAVAAPYLAGLALGALSITATATATAIATAVITVGLSVGLALGMRAIAGGTPVPRSPVGPPQVFRQSITDAFIVYGKRRVGGLMAFFHSAQDAGGAHLRYFVIACAGHRCQGVVSWMLNDDIVTVDSSGMVTSGPYANNAWLWFQRGLDSETANATFVAECGGNWTTDHKGNGVAAIYAKFRLTDDVVNAGMPNIGAVIEGKDDILDPRTATEGYTRNGPLIFYDWMKLAREEGGFGAYDDETPDDAFISAQANVADETVNSEPRYAIDAVIVTGSTPSEVRDALVVNMAGSYTYSGGKHLMRPGYWVPVSKTLSEDDLAGPIQVSPFMASDSAANQVTGTFVNPADGYQAAAFATQTASPAPTDLKQLDLDLAYTTSKYQAERIASIMLGRAQHEKTVMWPMNIQGLGVQALDTVQLDSSRYGLSNYAWQVGSWSLSADFGIVLNLKEEAEDIYTGPPVVAPVTPPTIVQPDPITTVDTAAILRASYPKALRAQGVDAGDGTATITLDGGTDGSAFTMDYATSTPQDVSVPAGSIAGLSYSTTYYLFADVTAPGDAAPTYGATTDYGTALNSASNPLRIYLNRAIPTPEAGGTATTPTGGGGGYGGSSDPGDGSGNKYPD